MAQKPKVRFIDTLSAEQLKRKRAHDRESKKQSREQTAAYIRQLQQHIQELEARCLRFENQAKSLSCSCQSNYGQGQQSISSEPWRPPSISKPPYQDEQNVQQYSDESLLQTLQPPKAQDWTFQMPSSESDFSPAALENPSDLSFGKVEANLFACS